MSRNSTSLKLDISHLKKIVLQTGFVTISDIEITEHQKTGEEVAIVSVSANAQWDGTTGFSLMLVASNASTNFLWAAHLAGALKDAEPIEISDNVLIPVELLGQAQSVAVRLYGAQFHRSAGSSTPSQGHAAVE